MPKRKRKKNGACSECGGCVRLERRPHILSYKGQQRTVETQAWWCTECGEGILSGSALRANESSFQELKASVEAVRLNRGANHVHQRQLPSCSPRDA
jgi:YgiT-type zinc finger domain-containing protein